MTHHGPARRRPGGDPAGQPRVPAGPLPVDAGARADGVRDGFAPRTGARSPSWAGRGSPSRRSAAAPATGSSSVPPARGDGPGACSAARSSGPPSSPPTPSRSRRRGRRQTSCSPPWRRGPPGRARGRRRSALRPGRARRPSRPRPADDGYALSGDGGTAIGAPTAEVLVVAAAARRRIDRPVRSGSGRRRRAPRRRPDDRRDPQVGPRRASRRRRRPASTAATTSPGRSITPLAVATSAWPPRWSAGAQRCLEMTLGYLNDRRAVRRSDRQLPGAQAPDGRRVGR